MGRRKSRRARGREMLRKRQYLGKSKIGKGEVYREKGSINTGKKASAEGKEGHPEGAAHAHTPPDTHALNLGAGTSPGSVTQMQSMLRYTSPPHPSPKGVEKDD